MSFEVEVAVGDQAVQRYLHKLAAAGRKPPIKRLLVIGVRSVLRNFRAEGRPKKWKRSRRAEEQGGKTLQDKGRLIRSVDKKILHAGTNGKVYTELDYAPVHQWGSRKRRMPARPFMLWQREDIRDIQQVLLQHLARVR